MDMMTEERTFVKVCEHAVKQLPLGQCKREHSNVCSYRINANADDLSRCFIGALIQDEHYNRKFEGTGVDAQTLFLALFNSGVPAHLESVQIMLGDLQSIHDNNSPKDWCRLLNEYANDRGWDTPLCMLEQLDKERKE